MNNAREWEGLSKTSVGITQPRTDRCKITPTTPRGPYQKFANDPFAAFGLLALEFKNRLGSLRRYKCHQFAEVSARHDLNPRRAKLVAVGSDRMYCSRTL